MKKNVTFLLVILLSILLCGGLSYIYLQSQDYATIDSYVLSREEAKRAMAILSTCPKDRYEVRSGELSMENYRLDEYRSVLSKVQDNQSVLVNGRLYNKQEREAVLSRYSYSIQQTDSMIKINQLCMERFAYVRHYKDFINSIPRRVEDLMEIQLFSAGEKNSFMKASKDFYGLENISITASMNVGVAKLLDSFLGEIFSTLCVLICAGIFALRYRSGAEGASLSLKKGSGIGWYGLGIFLGTAGIFMAEVFAVELTWGLEDLSRPIQSMTAFRSCPYLISMGMFLGIRILFQCCACLILFLVIIGLFFMEKKWMSAMLASVLLLTEILLDLRGVPYTLYGQFHAETTWGTYQNVLLFDKPISQEWILCLVVIGLLLLSGFFVGAQLKTALLTAREKAEQRYFEEVDVKYTEARILRHDMNNHLSALAMLLKENKKEDAERYLRQVMDELAATKPPLRTGINVLDAVLMGKETRAREKGIRLSMEFDPEVNSSRIPDYELCSLFGNLLDNAVEACERLPEADRWIRLRVSRQMEMLCVFCENPYDELRREDGKIVTRKEDPKNHGLGMRQMKRIAEKHGGTMEIDVKDQIFTVSILFQ